LNLMVIPGLSQKNEKKKPRPFCSNPPLPASDEPCGGDQLG
jgi:hypothetical protein